MFDGKVIIDDEDELYQVSERIDFEESGSIKFVIFNLENGKPQFLTQDGLIKEYRYLTFSIFCNNSKIREKYLKTLANGMEVEHRSEKELDEKQKSLEDEFGKLESKEKKINGFHNYS